MDSNKARVPHNWCDPAFTPEILDKWNDSWKKEMGVSYNISDVVDNYTVLFPDPDISPRFKRSKYRGLGKIGLSRAGIFITGDHIVQSWWERITGSTSLKHDEIYVRWSDVGKYFCLNVGLKNYIYLSFYSRAHREWSRVVFLVTHNSLGKSDDSAWSDVLGDLRATIPSEEEAK